MGGSYPGGGGNSGPYVTFMNSGSYAGDGMIQIHRGQSHHGQGELGGVVEHDLGHMTSLTSPDLQSPGHDSVSSSVTVGSGASSGCRNSTTSTDSGRGSSTSNITRPTQSFGHQHRYLFEGICLLL